jgi:hypothetical protein
MLVQRLTWLFVWREMRARYNVGAAFTPFTVQYAVMFAHYAVIAAVRDVMLV